jgi:hypothetical protein
MRPFAIFLMMLALLVSGAGGYLVGRRAQPAPRAVRCAEPSEPESIAAGAAPPRLPADYQALRNEVALCRAYRQRPDVPGHDLTTDALAGCRSQLELMKNPPRSTLQACYNFADLAPVYDRELGEADPSPETLERAAHLTASECGRVLHYSKGAVGMHRTCMSGAMPIGWKERYGTLIDERPFFKACYALPQYIRMNAMHDFEDDQLRATGAVIHPRQRMTPDGGHIAAPVDEEPGTE